MQGSNAAFQAKESRPHDDDARPTLRALLAEDNETNQMVFEAFLDLLGVSVEIVGDGRAAVDRWREGQFDLVMLDLHMPRLDGLSAIGEIRAEEAEIGLARTPLMLLSADNFPETRRAALQAGADHVAVKPIDKSGLRDALCEMTGLPTLG